MKNEFGVNKIDFAKSISLFCPLGNDYYSATVRVEFHPGDATFDFCDVDKAIQKMSGKHYIVEQLVHQVFDMLDKTYKPKYLKVSVDACSNVHFPVTVTKEK